jgi:hypothetical protein
VTKVNHGKRRGGQFACVAHFIFLNAWPLIKQVLADCLDSLRPPPPCFVPIYYWHPRGASEKRAGESEERRIPITICASSEPWAKAVICVPQTRHRCLVIRGETQCTVRRVDRPGDHTICLPLSLPYLIRFQNAYKAPLGVRPTKTTKGRFFPLSHSPCTLCSSPCLSASLTDIWPTVFWPDPSPSCPQLLLQVARSSSLDRIPSASCKVVRRSRARCVYSNCCPYFMCLFQMAVMHCHTFYSTPLFNEHRNIPFSSSSNGLIKQWHAGIRR